MGRVLPHNETFLECSLGKWVKMQMNCACHCVLQLIPDIYHLLVMFLALFCLHSRHQHHMWTCLTGLGNGHGWRLFIWHTHNVSVLWSCGSVWVHEDACGCLWVHANVWECLYSCFWVRGGKCKFLWVCVSRYNAFECVWVDGDACECLIVAFKRVWVDADACECVQIDARCLRVRANRCRCLWVCCVHANDCECL